MSAIADTVAVTVENAATPGVLQGQRQTQHRITSGPGEGGPAGQGRGHWQTHCGKHRCCVALALVNKQLGVCSVIQAHPVFQLHLG